MYVTLLIATSLNGYLTRDNEPSRVWASPEDQELFFQKREQARLIVMGRKTYESARAVIRLQPQTRRVVLTHHPEQFTAEAVPNQLEFTSESPLQVVQRLEQQGYTEMLLMGGSEVITEFLKHQLIHKIEITVEPWVFGAGLPLMSWAPGCHAKLQLLNVTQLNRQGTLLLEYKLE